MSTSSTFDLFYFPFLHREYDNLKGSLKSSHDLCEKLKREVLSSNNKVALYKWHIDVLNMLKYSAHRTKKMLSFFHFSCRKLQLRWIKVRTTWRLCKMIWPALTRKSQWVTFTYIHFYRCSKCLVFLNICKNRRNSWMTEKMYLFICRV